MRRPFIRIRPAAFAPLLILVFVSCSERPAERWPSEPGVAIANVNLRSGPATTWPVLTVIPKGAQVNIISRIGDWVQVSNGECGGYVAGRYVKSLPVLELEAASSDSNPGEKFLPAHRKILEDTGWFDYANGNIDAIEYYDWPSFYSSYGPAVGLAAFENGKRIARIALKDRTAEEVVSTIIHEAAHLSPIFQTGTFHSQDVAFAVEAQFRRALEALAFSSHHEVRTNSDQETRR